MTPTTHYLSRVVHFKKGEGAIQFMDFPTGEKVGNGRWSVNLNCFASTAIPEATATLVKITTDNSVQFGSHGVEAATLRMFQLDANVVVTDFFAPLFLSVNTGLNTLSFKIIDLEGEASVPLEAFALIQIKIEF